MWRGQGGKGKNWIDRVQSEVWAFGIAGDWKATLEARMLDVGRGGNGGGAGDGGLWSRRKTEEDATRHCREEREANETRKIVIVQGSVEPLKRHRLAW